jgi:uncharacterized membrane protein
MQWPVFNPFPGFMSVFSEREDPRFARHPLLITVVLPVCLLFFLATWSPPLMYHDMAEWYGSWQQSLFNGVCHQQPDRFLVFGGIPLANCSRCTGIYSGLFAGILLFSFFPDFINKSQQYSIRTFFVLSFVIAMDGSANFLQIWQTPDEMRLLTGVLWGISTGMILVRALIVPPALKTRRNQ